MKSNHLPNGILKAMEILAERTRPYQDAMNAMIKNADFKEALSNTLVSKFDIMDDALERGLFDNGLAQSVSELLAPYHMFSGAQEIVAAFGSSLKEMIDPEMYASVLETTRTTIEFIRSSTDFQTSEATFDPINKAFESDNTTWLKNKSIWLVEKCLLSDLNISNLSGVSSALSRLCILEHETSLLEDVPESFTSAVLQTISITALLEKYLDSWEYDELLSFTTLISDYCCLAIRQHELIQKASKSDEVSWRLGILDAASKYVDRQVDWYLHFADAIANEEIADTVGDVLKAETTALPLFPSHLGYTRRVDKTPAEGLEKSTILSITEKGKRIAYSVIRINKLRLDIGNDRIFGLSESVVGGLLSLSNIVCSSEEQFGKIIDALYFIFYENLKHIKNLVGNGDEEKGDQIVRKEDIYQCIFDVKTMRSDLRHDLNHGKSEDVKAKLKKVGDCYKKYCGNRPLKPKDFKKIQESIYDKVLELEDRLIQDAVSV